MKPLSAPTLGGVLVAGLLASIPTSAAPSEYLYLRAPGASVSARVTPDDISGPDLQLSRSSDAIRGRAYGRAVNLSLDKDRVSGIIGSTPVRLDLQRQDGVLEAEGLFAGQLTHLRLSKEEVSGTVGRCSYELKYTGDRYAGSRTCGRGLETPVWLEVPSTLATGGTAEMVASLALFLAQ